MLDKGGRGKDGVSARVEGVVGDGRDLDSFGEQHHVMTVFGHFPAQVTFSSAFTSIAPAYLCVFLSSSTSCLFFSARK